VEVEPVGLLSADAGGRRAARRFRANMTNPAPALARQAQQEISSPLVRMGRYGGAIRNSPEGDQGALSESLVEGTVRRGGVAGSIGTGLERAA
jgi:hypothetical protein